MSVKASCVTLLKAKPIIDPEYPYQTQGCNLYQEITALYPCGNQVGCCWKEELYCWDYEEGELVNQGTIRGGMAGDCVGEFIDGGSMGQWITELNEEHDDCVWEISYGAEQVLGEKEGVCFTQCD